jgi:hypothetical protein
MGHRKKKKEWPAGQSEPPAGSRGVTTRAVFTHGPKGPGPRTANFQGWHTKKIENEVWYAGAKKKGCPRDRNLREIYTENSMFCQFFVLFLLTHN